MNDNHRRFVVKSKTRHGGIPIKIPAHEEKTRNKICAARLGLDPSANRSYEDCVQNIRECQVMISKLEGSIRVDLINKHCGETDESRKTERVNETVEDTHGCPISTLKIRARARWERFFTERSRRSRKQMFLRCRFNVEGQTPWACTGFRVVTICLFPEIRIYATGMVVMEVHSN
ncbi:hypothetical protein ARMSODRAFT_981389 [Armillaria solidipes]|uniref:Uncharacterized protein n=1 Tax=Armillaria solidipes TaxID=1076256 RepID=A0A2H3B6I4_9AGAR|nr:hypothetical protein ARMSODRAFT_981389 [Armillaria solidipes]